MASLFLKVERGEALGDLLVSLENDAEFERLLSQFVRRAKALALRVLREELAPLALEAEPESYELFRSTLLLLNEVKEAGGEGGGEKGGEGGKTEGEEEGKEKGREGEESAAAAAEKQEDSVARALASAAAAALWDDFAPSGAFETTTSQQQQPLAKLPRPPVRGRLKNNRAAQPLTRGR